MRDGSVRTVGFEVERTPFSGLGNRQDGRVGDALIRSTSDRRGALAASRKGIGPPDGGPVSLLSDHASLRLSRLASSASDRGRTRSIGRPGRKAATPKRLARLLLGRLLGALLRALRLLGGLLRCLLGGFLLGHSTSSKKSLASSFPRASSCLSPTSRSHRHPIPRTRRHAAFGFPAPFARRGESERAW